MMSAWGLARFAAGVLLMIGSANCSPSTLSDNQTMQTAPRNITVTDKENGTQLELHRDDVLTLRLECIPGTGYSWQVSRNDAGILKPPDKPEYERPDRQKALGGVEYGIFRFKASARGTNVLELQYKRVWEKDKAPMKTFRITVRVD